METEMENEIENDVLGNLEKCRVGGIFPERKMLVWGQTRDWGRAYREIFEGDGCSVGI